MSIANSNIEIFEKVHPDYFPYYRSWCHDYPIVISMERDMELARVQNLLYRACKFYALHYKDYLDIISYPEKVLEILEYCKQYPFRAGMFRPDFIIDTDENVLLCEITSRFFGNGYFMSYFMDKAGADLAEKFGITDYKSYFKNFFDYTASMKENHKRLLVLKSSDKSDSIKLYVPYYEALGMETHIIEAEDVENNTDLFKDSMIVSALNQMDLLSFSMDTLKLMADCGMRNDFRTIFLLHDKRFFNLIFRNEFTDRFLNDEETEFLRSHIIPTYIYEGTATTAQTYSVEDEQSKKIWNDAQTKKDSYILKHHCLGKSEKVYAGKLTDEATWKGLFESGEVSEMILQPFIEQKIFKSPWTDQNHKEQILKEYLSPSILCVDDRYFGAGLFRSSSCEIINQGDAHKIIPIITDEPDKLRNYNVL